MSVLKRMMRYLRALIMGKLDEIEDPELMINETLREMKENQIKNRELAVQAITQKNNLQAEVDKLERSVTDLENKATRALQAGNRDLAKTFLREKSIQEQTLGTMRTSLAQASESSEKVKIAIKADEERMKVRAAEALAMKTQMKQAQIQITINKALDGLQFSDTEQDWNKATERITTMQSEANARAEVASTSVDARMREIEVSQMDVETDRQLAELEAKLAMGGNPASRYTNTEVQQVQTLGGGTASTSSSNGTSGASAAPESDIDRQLRELESRLGGQK